MLLLERTEDTVSWRQLTSMLLLAVDCRRYVGPAPTRCAATRKTPSSTLCIRSAQSQWIFNPSTRVRESPAAEMQSLHVDSTKLVCSVLQLIIESRPSLYNDGVNMLSILGDERRSSFSQLNSCALEQKPK